MKFLYIFLFIFSAIFMGVGGYFFWNSYNIISEGEKTVGTVVDHISSYDSDNGSTRYAPILQYTCNGLEEQNPSNLYSSSKYAIGTKLDIYCDLSSPNKFIIDSFMDKYFGLFFLIPGFITFGIAIGILGYSIKRKKLIEYLKSNGITITAKVTFVGENKLYTVNNKHPFYIKAIYKDGTNIIEFQSDNLWQNIYEKVRIGDSITIYVLSDLNGYDYKKYWMDTRFITDTDKF